MPFFRKYAELFGRNRKSVSELPHPENQKQPNGAFSLSIFGSPYMEGDSTYPNILWCEQTRNTICCMAFNRTETRLEARN